jgi:hypothetical protein
MLGPSYKSKSYATNINKINESNYQPLSESPRVYPQSAVKPRTIPKTYFGRNITSALLDKLERGICFLKIFFRQRVIKVN